MKSDQLSFRPGFRLSVANAKSQAAVMVLAVGGKEGGSDNFHKGADQWLYVVEGSGRPQHPFEGRDHGIDRGRRSS